MPLIIMTGIPASGKTTRTYQLKKYFEQEQNKRVHIVSEYDHIQRAGFDFRTFYKGSIFLQSLKILYFYI